MQQPVRPCWHSRAAEGARTMDAVSIVLALAVFAALLGLIELLDRV
jgi:hypothetical protein